jgi:uncharacterized membrane protein YdjX (TVP38/TMEM64 family)
MWGVACIIVLAAVYVALRVPGARQHAGQYIHMVMGWVRSFGPWGPVCFGAIFAATTLALISSSLMIAMAGFLFGFPGDFAQAPPYAIFVFLPVSLGFTVGAAVAFGLGRTLLRGWVQKKVAGHPMLEAIDKVVEEKGFRLVLLVRLTPMPSVLMNYAFGLTKVRFWPYVLGTWLGMIPRCLTYLYVGSTLQSAADLVAGAHEHGWHRWIHLGVGALVTVVVALLISRMAHKALKETLANGAEDPN